MAKNKKLLSMLLAFALILSSIFVGGISVSASLDSLYSTLNDYDNLPDGIEFDEVTYADYPATNVLINGLPEMEDSTNIRHFSAWAAWVDELPTELGSGNALHMTKANTGDKSNIYQTIARIYKSDSDTIAHFKPTANKTYEVKLKYYAATAPSKEIQLQIRQAHYSQCSFQNGNISDGIWMEPVVVASITEATGGWVEAVAYFTAPETPYYINLCLSAATSGSASNVDVWVDDLSVSECTKMTVNNYTPDANKSVPVSKLTTIGDLQPDGITGYRFGGVFSDEALENRISTDALAGSYTEVYFSWLPVTINELECGFEEYSQLIKDTCYNSAVSQLVSGTAYIGKYSMKTTLNADGIAAFEIKNANSFSLIKDKEYTVSFAYKTDAAAEIYVGTGKLGNTPQTAKALIGTEVSATDGWSTATLTFTADNGSNEAYVPAMLIYAENGATVYIDDILVSGFGQGYVNPTLNTGFSSDWYPNLALFEGVELPEIWGGAEDLSEPKDSDNDGVYEISNGAELAYVIKNGGGADAKYVLTKDIYLNDTDAINWKTGEVIADGYTPNVWYNQSVSFQGTIDGDGHTVYGLYRKDNPAEMFSYPSYGTGLIPVVPSDAAVTLKNLAVDNAFINVECGASAFVGTSNGGDMSFERCYVGENVQLNGGDSGAFVGYSGGEGGALTISNSYSLATTSGVDNYGLVGTSYQATLTVTNSFNANGPITSYENANWTGKYTYTNSYQSEEKGNHNYFYKTNFETLTDDSLMKGLDVFESGKMEYLNSSNVYIATEGYPKLAFFEGIELPTIWGGKSDLSEPQDSDEDGVLEITNGAELAYAISNGGGAGVKYILTKDIYLNNISKINWETGEVTNGYTANSWYHNYAFQGSIDGDGHTVYGLYYKDTSAMSWAVSGVGLIPRVCFGTTAELKNLAVDNAYVYGHAGASALVGCGGTDNSEATTRAEIIIDRCAVGENVTILGTSAGAFRGITRGANITVTNSYSLADVTGDTYGLFAGETWQSSVVMSNSFNANGPFGSAASGTFTNCYQTEAGANGSNVIDAEYMKGEDVFTNSEKMPNLNSDGAFTATTGYPEISVFIEETASDDENTGDGEDETTEIWDGSVAESFAGGDGTEENPYQISNGAQLALAISTGGQVSADGVYTDEANFNKYYVITKDIYLNDITKINWITGAADSGYTANAWLKHENFAGTIDGNGHIIYGLYYNDKRTESNVTSFTWGMGLIPYVINGNAVTVKNLGIDNVFVNYECGASAFIGTLNDGSSATIDTCFVGSKATLFGADSGAFRGFSEDGTTVISNCYSLADVTGVKNEAGFIGKVSGATTVSYSYNGNGVMPTGSGVTCTNCYQSEGTDSTGITTVSSENMKGSDVLTNSSKMPQLKFASAYTPSSIEFEEHDYYVYLPIGTVLGEDYEPSFLDIVFTGLDAATVLDGNVMKRGAYVKFAKEPDAANISVPCELADFIRQGTYAEVSADSIHESYYGIDTEIVSKQLSNQPEDALNYLFITDIHFMNYDLSWDTQGNILIEQVKLVAQMLDSDPSLDFMVVGGDIAQGFWDNKSGHLEAISTVLEPLESCAKPVLVLMGNHDDNAYATWNVNYSEKIVSDLDWKNTVLDPIAPADIVRPSDDANAKHYYYDLTKNGKTTRIFCLDSIDYYQEYDENGVITALEIRDGYTEESDETYNKYYNGRSYLGYSAVQTKWLAESLAQSDEFDDVLIFSHMGTDALTNSTAPAYGAEIAEVIAAYNHKTAYKNDDLGIDVSYTDDGKILSYQYGHIHRESYVYNADMDLWQIGSSTARADQANNKAIRTIGTDSEACFDAMSVSRSAVRKFNIGGGENKEFISNAVQHYGDVNLNNTTDICDLVALAKTANGDFGKTTAADVNRDNLISYDTDAAALRKRIIGK